MLEVKPSATPPPRNTPRRLTENAREQGCGLGLFFAALWAGLNDAGAGVGGRRLRRAGAAPDTTDQGANVTRLSHRPTDHEDRDELHKREEDAPERGEENEEAHLLENNHVHGEEQRNGSPTWACHAHCSARLTRSTCTSTCRSMRYK